MDVDLITQNPLQVESNLVNYNGYHFDILTADSNQSKLINKPSRLEITV